jgi:hypothetical protein
MNHPGWANVSAIDILPLVVIQIHIHLFYHSLNKRHVMSRLDTAGVFE